MAFLKMTSAYASLLELKWPLPARDMFGEGVSRRPPK